jgi:hypothetical protein
MDITSFWLYIKLCFLLDMERHHASAKLLIY